MNNTFRLGFAAVFAVTVSPLCAQVDHAKVSNGGKVTLPAWPADHAGNVISTAHAEVKDTVADKGPVTEKKAINASGGSGLADTGNVNGTQAKAEAKWTIADDGIVHPSGKFYKIFTNGTFAEVIRGANAPPGLAKFNLNDPIEYTGANGMTLPLLFGLEDFSITAEGVNSYAALSQSAGSNIAGLENLFTLSISLNGAHPDVPSIDFWSNPLLMLDNSVIKKTIMANLAFDAPNATYSGTFDFLAIDLHAPLTQDTLSISWNVAGIAVAVPEPATVGLSSLGLIGGLMIRRRWRRTKQNAAVLND